jgi:hypothetical protein
VTYRERQRLADILAAVGTCAEGRAGSNSPSVAPDRSHLRYFSPSRTLPLPRLQRRLSMGVAP